MSEGMKKVRRIVAIIGIILLVALYIMTLVFAVTDNPESMHMFAMSIIATVVIPVFIYVLTMFMKMGKNRGELNEKIASGEFADPASCDNE